MKKSHAIFLVSAFIVFAAIFSGGILLSNIRWNDGNPYEKDGLKVKWAVGGATNSYPWIEVWVMHEGNKIEPDISFGGFEDPDLDFRDYDGDGLKDIVFEDGGRVKAVAFFPGSGDRVPRFVTLRNDSTSG